MNADYIRLLQVFFSIADLIVLNISYIVAKNTYEETAESRFYYRYHQYWIIINWFWITISLLGGMYRARYILYFFKFLKKTAGGALIFFLLVLIYLHLPRLILLSNSMVYLCIVLFLCGLGLNRVLYLGIREWVKKAVHSRRRILLIGFNSLSVKLASYIESEEFNVNVMGFVDDKPILADPKKYPVQERLERTMDVARTWQINEMYTTIMPENNARVFQIMDEAEKALIRFRIVPDFREFVDRPVEFDQLFDIPLLSLRREPLEFVLNRFNKRLFDIIFSLLVTVFILSWLFPLLGLLIYLESPGPVLFRQLRSGKNKKPFWCYKFRSMTANNGKEAVQATRHDARVTRIGRFIRRTSLDEFPQFLNVLKGEMSIVGPRPHMLLHNEQFQLMEHQYVIRQFLKPGITGWAQINGFRGEITEPAHIKKRVEHDLWYLENWSILLDMEIVFLTVYNVFKGEEKAY
jgi:putative colanic acid biosysnthesis UDP-glucose lipid carrier transferase